MSDSPTIRISLGAHTLARFVESAREFEWKYIVGPDVLGPDPVVILVIETSETVKVPGDPRDLGISIERLDWDPAR